MVFEYKFGKKKSNSTDLSEYTISPERLNQIQKQMHDFGLKNSKTKSELEEEIKTLKDGTLWLIQENEFLKEKVDRLEEKIRTLKKIYEAVRIEFEDE